MKNRCIAGLWNVQAVGVAMVASVLCVSSATAAEVTRWSFEGSGNDTAAGGVTADNLSGNGTITFAAGVSGQAVSLAAGWLSVADPGVNSDLDLASATWTVECFIKDGLAPALWKRLVWKWSPSSQIHWALRNNKFDLFVNGGSVIAEAGPVLNDSHWHHIAMANDAGANTLKVWVDGMLVYSGAAIAVTDTASPFWLGHSVDRFTGLIDEFIIHDEAKDQTYMRQRAALLPEELVIEYKFEDNLDDTATGGAVADTLLARNNVNGIITPPADDYEAGVVGKALRLGQNTATDTQWAGAADGADADVPPRYTLEAFIRPDVVSPVGHNRILLHWANDAYHLSLSSTMANIHHGESDGGTPNAAGGIVMAGNWYHIAATADPTDTNGGANPDGTLRVWLNGVGVGAVAYDGTVGDSGNLIWLGSNPGVSEFVGLIDEARVWHNVAKDGAYMQERTRLMMSLVPTTGLRAYYQFEGDTRDVAPLADVNAGTVDDDLVALDGAVSYEPGQVERAVRLNGNYLIAPYSTDIEFPSQFTIESWVKADDPGAGWRRLVLKWGGVGENSYHFALLDGDVDLYITQSGGSAVEARGVAGYELTTGWHHVAGVADGGSQIRVYVDGLQVGSAAYDGTIQTSAAEGLGVADGQGAPAPTIRFTGLLDEVALWGVALDGGAIAAHFSRGPMGYDLVLPPQGTIFVVR